MKEEKKNENQKKTKSRIKKNKKMKMRICEYTNKIHKKQTRWKIECGNYADEDILVLEFKSWKQK